MKTYTAELQGLSPYSQSKHHTTEKLERESAADYEKRTWRERLHVLDNGQVFCPPMAIKNALAEIAKFLGEQIPGKGKSTFTKHFEAGVMVIDPIPLTLAGKPVMASEVKAESLFLPASGKRGDGKRVDRLYPFVPTGWTGTVVIHVIDHTITSPVLQKHLEQAGSLIGIGRFRPRQNGYYGRYAVTAFREVVA